MAVSSVQKDVDFAWSQGKGSPLHQLGHLGIRYVGPRVTLSSSHCQQRHVHRVVVCVSLRRVPGLKSDDLPQVYTGDIQVPQSR